MPRLALTFLGPPLVSLDGSPVRLKRRKPLALLAYLAVTARTQSRDVLTEMLYPGHPRDQGYSDFRQTLTVLRQVIGANWFIADQTGVRLRDGKDLWVDVMEFRRLIQGAKTRDKVRGSDRPERLLTRAAVLVRGTFLAGFYLKDCPEFEDWQNAEGEGLRRDQAWVLERLVDLHQSREEYREAIEPCQGWLALDTFDEAVHRRLMQLYALSGQRSLALKQYERCRTILEKELREKPGMETEELREQIARERFAPHEVHPAGHTPGESSRHTSARLPFVGRERELRYRIAHGELLAAGLPFAGAPIPVSTPHNLRLSQTAFIGRDVELSAVTEAMRRPDLRLLTITGAAGTGKTRHVDPSTTFLTVYSW